MFLAFLLMAEEEAAQAVVTQEVKTEEINDEHHHKHSKKRHKKSCKPCHSHSKHHHKKHKCATDYETDKLNRVENKDHLCPTKCPVVEEKKECKDKCNVSN